MAVLRKSSLYLDFQSFTSKLSLDSDMNEKIKRSDFAKKQENSIEKSCQFFTFIFETHAKDEYQQNNSLERQDLKCYF